MFLTNLNAIVFTQTGRISELEEEGRRGRRTMSRSGSSMRKRRTETGAGKGERGTKRRGAGGGSHLHWFTVLGRDQIL